MESRNGGVRVLWMLLFGFVAVVGAVFVLGGLLVVLLLGGLHVRLGPGNGKHSRRLPVTASPSTGLVDGSPVTVASRAFPPNRVVGVTVCLGNVATRGSAACDLVSGSRFATGQSGLIARYRVPRVITVRGRPHDCALGRTRCWLVAASADDFNDSGGVPISFRPGLPTVTPVAKTVRPQTRHLPISSVPAGAIRSGTNLVASAAGFVPGEPVVVGWCSDRFEVLGPKACDPESSPVAAIALTFHALSAVTDHADQLGRFTTDASVPGTVVPYSAGPVECASGPGKCVLVIAAAADTGRSAVLPVTVMS